MVSSPDFSSVHEQVLSYVIRGTLVVLACIFVLLLVSYANLGNTYVGVRIATCFLFLAYILFTWLLLRKGYSRIAAWLVVCFYFLLAASILVAWSINAPVGVLLLGFIITLSGVTLGSRVVLPVSIALVLLLVAIQSAVNEGWVQPDRTTLMNPPHFGDVASYGIFLGAFGLISWIASLKIEQLLAKRMVAEKELRRQKASVAKKLEQRTKVLQETQLRETKYLYGFAELGQLSTALLHDLSNHLTVLSLEIEDLEQQKHSQAIARAQRSIRYLDEMVSQVRLQLKEGGQKQSFEVRAVLAQVFSSLESKAQQMGVRLQVKKKDNPETIHCYGDPVRFRYIMTIVLGNSIDAYSQSTRTARRVEVAVRRIDEMLVLHISDWGVGIVSGDRRKVFQPFYSTKEQGMGIGLFIVKEMLASHFHGTITLEHPSAPTTFRLQVPISSRHEVSDEAT